MAAHDPRLKPPPGNVLVVDDVESNRDLLRRRLERQGFDVRIACDGRQALERIRQESFDLVLLDVMMPQLAGDQVLQAIRKEHSSLQLPVIMVTAKDQSQDVVKLLQLGANDYVTKPIDFDVLLARMDVQLSRRRAEQERQRLVEALEQTIRRDTLTGLYNRHHLDEILGKELEQAKRCGHALSLMVVDLDGFKRVNDELGHLKGDEVLRTFGRLLRQHLRQTDLAFRYGGDEFVVLMSRVADQPNAAAERLREVFRESVAQIDLRGYPLGLSIGTVTCEPGMALDAQSMLRQADLHLHREKSRQSISQLALETPGAAQPALAQTEFQSLFLDSVGELIVATELDGTIFYANRAFRRWVDLPAHALLGKRLADAVPAFSALVGQAQAGDLSQEQVLWEALGAEPRVLLVTPSRLETDRARLFAHVYVGVDVTSLERSKRRLSLVFQLSQELAQLHTVDEIAQHAADWAVKRYGHDLVGIAILEGQEGRIAAYAGSPSAAAYVGKRYPLSQSALVSRAINSRDIVRIDDVSQDPEYFEVDSRTRSELVAPICFQDRVLGALNMESFTPAAFGSRDEELARFLAGELAIAITNVQRGETLLSAQRHFRSLVENVQDIVTVLNLDGTIRYSNPAIRRVLGYEPEELEGRSALEFVHPDDVEKVASALVQGLASPQFSTSMTYRFRHKDGSWRTLEGVGKNLMDDPLVRGAVITSRDVTAFKRG